MKDPPHFPPTNAHRSKLQEFKIKIAQTQQSGCTQSTVTTCFSYQTHLLTLTFSQPFCLFLEVACPLSKVCFAKGRVHFHIFPFDMRRLSIGLCFLVPISCLSPSSSLFSFSSCCSAHSHFPGPCSLGGGVGWGGPRKM